MSDIQNASMITIMNEFLARDNDTQNKLFDASCIIDKIKLIAYGLSEKYHLDDATLTDVQQMDYLNARCDMGTDVSILNDYIQRLDVLINSIGGMSPVTDD